jgi:hypothetical protein
MQNLLIPHVLAHFLFRKISKKSRSRFFSFNSPNFPACFEIEKEDCELRQVYAVIISFLLFFEADFFLRNGNFFMFRN